MERSSISERQLCCSPEQKGDLAGFGVIRCLSGMGSCVEKRGHRGTDERVSQVGSSHNHLVLADAPTGKDDPRSGPANVQQRTKTRNLHTMVRTALRAARRAQKRVQARVGRGVGYRRAGRRRRHTHTERERESDARSATLGVVCRPAPPLPPSLTRVGCPSFPWGGGSLWGYRVSEVVGGWLCPSGRVVGWALV